MKFKSKRLQAALVEVPSPASYISVKSSAYKGKLKTSLGKENPAKQISSTVN